MSQNKLIIGLAGKAGSGKDTVACEWRRKKRGLGLVGFADPLKEAAKAIFGLNTTQVYHPTAKNRIDSYWAMTPRDIMQRLGTECCRQHFGDDIWVKSAYRRVKRTPYTTLVFTDVRFPNEAQAIQEWGGYLVKVVRPGYESPLTVEQQNHPSETALDKWQDWDAILVNGGSLRELVLPVDEVLTALTVLHKEGRGS